MFVLVAIAGIRMTGRWLPRAGLVAGVLALLGLAALNPERLIADRNIDRFEQTGALDAEYVSGLSSDIDPALARLPEHVRSLVHHPCVGDLGWIADAPEVPLIYRPARSTLLMSSMSSAEVSGYPGRVDRRQGYAPPSAAQ